jgi:5'-3' exonuclease
MWSALFPIMQTRDYTGVIANFFARAMCMIRANIIPVFVFDSIGAVSDDKDEERQRRAKRRSDAHAELLEMGWDNLTPDEKEDRMTLRQKFLQMALTIEPDLIFACIRGCRAHGMSYFVSPGEADHQIVHLVQSGACAYACSIDGDILAHGIPVIRSFHYQGGNGLVYCLKTGQGWWNGLEAAVAYAFFVGCDYTPGIPQIGKVKAVKIMEACNGDFSAANVISVAFNLEKAAMQAVDGGIADSLITRFEKVRHCYTKGKVYNPISKSVQLLDGTAVYSNSESSHAAKLALGLRCLNASCTCSTVDEYHDIGVVSGIIIDNDISPQHLTFDMVCTFISLLSFCIKININH